MWKACLGTWVSLTQKNQEIHQMIWKTLNFVAMYNLKKKKKIQLLGRVIWYFNFDGT